jgi:hypothetical protein
MENDNAVHSYKLRNFPAYFQRNLTFIPYLLYIDERRTERRALYYASYREQWALLFATIT